MFKPFLFSCAVTAAVLASSLELHARGPGGGSRGGRSGSAGGRANGGRSGGARPGGGRSSGARPGGGFSGSLQTPGQFPSAPGRSNAGPRSGSLGGNFGQPGSSVRPGGLDGRSPRQAAPTASDLQNFLNPGGPRDHQPRDHQPGAYRPGDVEGRRATATETAHSHAQNHAQAHAGHWQQHAGELAHQAHHAYHANNFPYAKHWTTAHPHAAAYGWAVHGYHPLTTATWAAAAAWTGAAAAGSYAYDYPATVVYESGDVYIGGESAGSAADYSSQATSLATAGTQAVATKSEEWLPLGVFAIAPEKVGQPTALTQLAVNKAGILEGAYYDTISDSMQPIKGSVDAKTGRAAWSVGGNQKATFEASLQALTRDSGPLLLHLQGNQVQHWSLARMKQ